MIRRIGTAGIALWATALLGQNPYATAPRNYFLELDNDWVRVSRAIYHPGDKIPEHQHPDLPTVYVYLTDGGPVHFSHIRPSFTAKRGAVKMGGIRFHSGSKETHVVEYEGDTVSEFLRIELKTERPDKKAEHVRLAPEDGKGFENGQIRIERCGGKSRCAAAYPAVVVDVAAKSFRWQADAGGAGEGAQGIRVELKTKPGAARPELR